MLKSSRILPYLRSITTKKDLFHSNNSAVPIATNTSLELTLAILKPHICKDPFRLQEIRQIILDNRFLFVRSTRIELTRANAEQFYEEHKGKFFFNRLVSFMSSGEIWAHILARPDAIARWRQLMGPTKVYRTRFEHPETIRGRFGATDTRNATHGSDSPESARKEIGFFFPEFSINSWYERDEPLFRSFQNSQEKIGSEIEFDNDNWIHRLKSDQIDKKNVRV